MAAEMDVDQCWEMLLNPGRRKKEARAEESATPQDHSATDGDTQRNSNEDTRTEIERDYDRILFSTPVRRLADKTQVFPLDQHDSVRTRLTHSHEVSNLARSIGTTLTFDSGIAGKKARAARDLPSLLAAVGLVHDLGNPPFGHQGEVAIQSWFKDYEGDVLSRLSTEQQKQDFKRFEGNAQGFRLVTRLQLLNDNFGLDLTYATLAAMMKYPTCSDQTNKARAATKKHGFFASEQEIAERVLERTGLELGKRHAAAYIMEACDDIAYVVLDVEDAVKKGLASFPDLMAYLRCHGKHAIVEKLIRDSEEKHEAYRRNSTLSPDELNDVSMQRFRVFAIGTMVRAATKTFIEKQSEFVYGTADESLLAGSEVELLRKLLKEFGLKHGYTHRSVLKIELDGYNVLRSLMDMLWAAIVDRENDDDAGSDRVHPFSRYVYLRISENYRRVFEHPSDDVAMLPMRYRECLLLTDMISGMTDSYAINLHAELKGQIGEFDPVAIRVKKSHEGGSVRKPFRVTGGRHSTKVCAR